MRVVCRRLATLGAFACVPLSLAAAQQAPDSAPPDTAREAAPARALAPQFTITGGAISRLPLDDPREALLFAPGVLMREPVIGVGAGFAAALRDGTPGEAAAYVDGAPVRMVTFGLPGALVGTAGTAALSMSAGVVDVSVPDIRDGAISYVTPAGGSTIHGTLGAQTDGIASQSASVGYNRFEGGLGGPVPSVPGLTWYVAASLQGQLSRYRGFDGAAVPTYVLGGLDTTVAWNDGSAVRQVVIPRYLQYSGTCTGGATGQGSAADIAANYGTSCVGARLPMDWGNVNAVQAKLAWKGAGGTTVSLTGLASGLQSRTFPANLIGDPLLFMGEHFWSRLYVLNAARPVTADGRLRARVNLSYGTDRDITGPLAPASEADTRAPSLGIELSALEFNFPGGFAEQWFQDPDRMIRNIRNNQGLRVPLLNRTDLRNVQPYRMNPYGMYSGGWYTNGFAVSGSLYSESRWSAQAALEWKVAAGHLVSAGFDVQHADLARWAAGFLSEVALDAYHGTPGRFGVFASDRFGVGPVQFDAGLRFDRVSPGGIWPNTPGFIFGADNVNVSSTDPWNPLGYTDDTAYANSLARTFTAGKPQAFVTPRIGAAWRPTAWSELRAAYGQALVLPDYGVAFGYSNADLMFTSISSPFGRDVPLRRQTRLELGASAALTRDFTVDLGVWRHSHPGYAFRVLPYADPAVPGQTVNLTSLVVNDDGHDWGLDVGVRAEAGRWVSVTARYGYQSSRGAGALSYLEQQVQQTSGSTGVPTPSDGAVGAAPHQHVVAGLVTAAVPAGWRAGTWLGRALDGLRATVVGRAASGIAWTPFANQGDGILAVGGTISPSATPTGPFNSQRTPWTKVVDLRLAKTFPAGRFTWTAFADVLNVLNIRTVLNLFAETGTTTNTLFQGKLLAPEFAQLSQEAQVQNARLPDGSVDLRGSCLAWAAAEPAYGVVNCVMLQRAEARFGDGDGIYTPAEQARALDSEYALSYGPDRFYGPGRTLRVGVQLDF